MADGLTSKQRKFCDEYLVSGNATEAAAKAGYSQKTAVAIGNENLRKPKVKAYIDSQLEIIHNKKTADAQEVMEYLTSVLRGKSLAEVVVVENIGDYMSEARRVEKAPDEKERLKAAELLGKRFGIFTDRVSMEIVQPVFDGEDNLED